MATDQKSTRIRGHSCQVEKPARSGSLQKTVDPDEEAGEHDMTALPVPRPTLPCHAYDPDLWFAEAPADLERAKALCADCPVRRQCLSAALHRAEPWGVWGGEIFERGAVVSRKRPRGRPRKDAVAA
jgi:WhiB family transcriptional regulator, redox-sensing transcriptional regulator